MTKVLDSWVVVAWLQKEQPAFEYFVNLIELADAGEVNLLMNIINFGEVYYSLMRKKGEDIANSFWDDFNQFPIKLVGVSKSQLLTAAKSKGKYAISYADSFAAATAIAHECQLVTGDPKFVAVSSLIEIEWLERKQN